MAEQKKLEGMERIMILFNRDLSDLREMKERLSALISSVDIWIWQKIGKSKTRIAPIKMPDIFKDYWCGRTDDITLMELKRSAIKAFWEDVELSTMSNRIAVGGVRGDDLLSGQEAVYAAWSIDGKEEKYFLIIAISPKSCKAWLLQGETKHFFNPEEIGRKKSGLKPCQRIKILKEKTSILRFGEVAAKIIS